MSERDRVIDAFMCACYPVPSEEQVQSWRTRHPRHAAAIARHAELMARYAPGSKYLDDACNECMREVALECAAYDAEAGSAPGRVRSAARNRR